MNTVVNAMRYSPDKPKKRKRKRRLIFDNLQTASVKKLNINTFVLRHSI